MKFFSRFRMLLLIAVGLMLANPRADAQGFGFSVTASTNLVVGTSSSLTYGINLTNQTGILLTNVFVTNTFSAGVTVISATNSQGSNSIISSSLIFNLGAITNGNSAKMSLTVQPTTAGFLTNMVVVAATGVTNTASTNVVTQVFTAQADLGVSIIPPVQAVITNDLTAYDVIVTNLGPDAAPNVALTNTLPPGVILKGVNQGYTVSSSNLIFSLGTIASGGSTDLQFLIQPTNAGVLTFSASVGAPGLLDTNAANNSASTNINVISYLPGTLVAVTNSAQTINLQNGLTEQSILLSNIGATDVAAARVVVTGLANQLFNAVGTNNGSPFVYYSTTLAAGKSVNLLLQYNPRGFFPFTNGQLHAFAVPLPNWTPPKATSTSTNINISRIVKLSNGNMLIEFPSTLGQAYTVVYSDNVLFSNAMIAPPSIVAPANRMQWIDYGPPTTVSVPVNANARFYRVFLNQ
jgi:uncharacterized repeat protein (TIGR01451 family)